MSRKSAWASVFPRPAAAGYLWCFACIVAKNYIEAARTSERKAFSVPAINEKTRGHAATASVISALRAFLWRSHLSKFRRVLLAVCCCSGRCSS